jgi:hypothetical protein
VTFGPAAQALPRALSEYADQAGASLLHVLIERVRVEPFNAIATAIFTLAILHTFLAARLTARARAVQEAHEARLEATGRRPFPSVWAEALHFFGEVEVVFGLWAVVLLVAMAGYAGWPAARHYFNDSVNYTEPLFVVVIMALAASRPIVGLAEAALGRIARVGRGSVAAWWIAILVIGPLLGSFITEPAAMTICALLLARQFYNRDPSARFKYATLGLLFVNVSIGGTLTTFAAPPVLMVARTWAWDTTFMLTHFGWRAALAIGLSTLLYALVFRRELRALDTVAPPVPAGGVEAALAPGSPLPIPAWLTVVHLAFMAWTVLTAHEPALFLGGFLFFLGFAKATAAYQDVVDLRAPLLVGFFLAGLVIHGGLQGWWIQPILSRLPETPLFLGGTALTAFNDNAMITYLATLVPNLGESLKIAVVGGAVAGGGLTVIANAPNPAGQALLGRFFGNAIIPSRLFAAALMPTAIVIVVFLLF